MTDYFRYDVHFVMNITDIDDKVRTGYGANIIKHLSPVSRYESLAPCGQEE